MAKYQFQARKLNGQVISGEVIADNILEANEKIRALKVIPISVEDKILLTQKKVASSKLKVNSKELQIFTRQLAVLINAGVPIVQAIHSISRGSKSLSMKKALTGVAEFIEGGMALYDAMAQYPYIFNFIYTSLVKAGEESGTLDTTLERLAVHIEKSNNLKKKIKGALVYPVGVLVFALLITFGLLAFVFPKFVGMYTKKGQELPWLTAQVQLLSDLAVNYWYVGVIGIVGFVAIITAAYRSEEGRKAIDKILIDLPLLGSFLEKACIARFSRSFSTLLNAGIRVSAVLKTCSNTSGNWIYEKILLEIEQLVTRGQTLEEAFSSQNRFPRMVVQMVGVGEEGGSLEIVFSKIADFYEDEVENAATTFGSVLEPIMLVGIGGIVAILVLAMYLPIFGLAQAI